MVRKPALAHCQMLALLVVLVLAGTGAGSGGGGTSTKHVAMMVVAMPLCCRVMLLLANSNGKAASTFGLIPIVIVSGC